jgi:hypothetical protein
MTASVATLRSISAPDRVDSRVGTLESVDGVPSGETAQLVYDHLDFVHGLNVYFDGFAGASTYALRKGIHEAGAQDNAILIFSELMGSESVFLTANADTVDYVGVVDLTSGPMLVETPPQVLGVFDDIARRRTGSRRRKARAGSRSCASTVHWLRSSTRPGGRAKSSPWRRTASRRAKEE